MEIVNIENKDEIEDLSLNNNSEREKLIKHDEKKPQIQRKKGKICNILLNVFFFILGMLFTFFFINNSNITEEKNTSKTSKTSKISKTSNSTLFDSIENKSILFNPINNENLNDFVPIYSNFTEGPITINRNESNGYKENIYKLILPNLNEEFESFYYDYKNFKNLNETIIRDDEYICETNYPTEGIKGYNLSCPTHYTIVINEAMYGRYSGDQETCNSDYNGNTLPSYKLISKESCVKNVTFTVKELCEGKVECTLKPSVPFFGYLCTNIYKYLHVKYHCKKDKILKKPKIAIVTFANKVEVNSIYEHAFSDFYQYSNIHGYKFIVNRNRYDSERDIYYMKLHTLLDAVTNGLKTKEYDWVFWVDSDCIIANPNIKIETFIPNDNKVHFIGAIDHRGFNSGVLLFRVHDWTLNFLSRSIAFAYYNKNKRLVFPDQTSLNDVLTSDIDESEHYIIVPQKWFNNYPDKLNPGDFIAHFAGRPDKKKDMESTIDELKKDKNYLTSKTNKDLRKEVLEYYNLPKNEQLKIKYDK